jgi:hypothetical protein
MFQVGNERKMNECTCIYGHSAQEQPHLNSGKCVTVCRGPEVDWIIVCQCVQCIERSGSEIQSTGKPHSMCVACNLCTQEKHYVERLPFWASPSSDWFSLSIISQTLTPISRLTPQSVC